MEDSQLEHRIRFYNYLQDATRQAPGVCRSLVEILADHTYGMTNDELRSFILDKLAPSLEQAWHERDALAGRAEASRQEAEREREARKKAEKEAADKEKENAALRKALEDERNKNKTHVRNKFGSSSRRSCTAKGISSAVADRAQEKDSFDGNEQKARASEAAVPVDITGEGDKVMTDAEVDAHNARLGMTYEKADAKELTSYPCNRAAIPEGWEIWDDTPVYKTMFDTRTVVTARKVEFVKIRRWVKAVNQKTGEEYWRWEYKTMHFPYEGETLKKDVGVEGEASMAENKPYDTKSIPGMVPGTTTTPGTATKITMDNFLCFTPVNRICEVFREYGFRKRRQGATNWLHKYAELCRPLYERLKDRVFKDGAVLFMDETWFRLHLPTGDRKVYEWVVGNKVENCIMYHYDNGSRGKDVIKELIKGRKIKAIHTDGYNAYIFLEGLGIVHIACTAHIWRYIMDWYNATESEDARMLLAQIAALYTIEAEIRGKSPEEILDKRKSDEVTAILTNYKARLELLHLRLDALPGIGQTAVNYALKLYPNMEKWREDPDYEIDNNFAERAARPVAMHRKTQNHVASHKGAEASCILRSLIETCKLWKVSVCEYLNKIYTAFSVGRTDYDNLMPWCMQSFS